MFDKNFYPTPRAVYDLMCLDVRGKVVLEPHAGSGNILGFMAENFAKELLCCEKNIDLAEIAKTKAKFLVYDFFDLKSEQISHIDMIVMNPPFDYDSKHIVHAYEIAPGGCEIISLCNASTIEEIYTWKERQLKALIRDYGNAEILGDVFSDAERKTNVSVGLIKLYKPRTSSDDYSEYFTEDEDDSFGDDRGGLMNYNVIREIVQRYVQAVKDYREYEAITSRINDNLKEIGMRNPFKVEVSHNENVTDYAGFLKATQKSAWAHVFRSMNIGKYLSKGVKDDLNKFVEQNQKFPFTMKNIYKMLDVIIQTNGQTIIRSLVEAVDYYTKYTKDNRYELEGWKTNLGYMLNDKFIIDYMTEVARDGYVRIKTHCDRHERLDDLIKVICYLSGNNYDKVDPLSYASAKKPYMYRHYSNKLSEDKILQYDQPHDCNQFETNKWYVSEFFEFKVFKKGTMHLKFRDKQLWYMLNYEYAKSKGFNLPSKI